MIVFGALEAFLVGFGSAWAPNDQTCIIIDTLHLSNAKASFSRAVEATGTEATETDTHVRFQREHESRQRRKNSDRSQDMVQGCMHVSRDSPLSSVILRACSFYKLRIKIRDKLILASGAGAVSEKIKHL